VRGMAADDPTPQTLGAKSIRKIAIVSTAA
jgi:hypothetical protein